MSAIWSATSGVSGGPHVVLVHGTLDRSAGLLKLARRLDERYRVTRYDRRGYGRSRPCDGPFGIDEQVEDLVGVIRDASVAGTPRVIVGHSYGGNVALALADRHPNLVDGVVTYESPMSWLEWWPTDSAGANAVTWHDQPEEAAERFMRRLVGDERWERLPATTREARRAEGPAMVGEMIDLRRRPPWDPDRIGVPVLALHGERGAAHHHRAAAELRGLLPAADVVPVAGARHFGPNTHPDDVAALVTAFVDGLSASA